MSKLAKTQSGETFRWRATFGKALVLVTALSAVATWSLPAQGPIPNSSPGVMVLVPAGVYRPLFRSATDPKEVPVKPFYLDARPVTVGDFLQFVRANPNWRRSQVKHIFADESYLRNWEGDLNPGSNTALDLPVTWVSWFAAKAYAHWAGKRLPTVAEWEYAASASPQRPDGENDPVFRREILQWYTTPNSALAPAGSGPPNFWGIYNLHGLVWEWVLDFNSAMVTGDSRANNNLEQGLFGGSGSQSAKNVGDYPAFMRWGFRSSLSASYCVHNQGFRCARDVQPGPGTGPE